MTKKPYDFLIDNKELYNFEYNSLYFFNRFMLLITGFYIIGIFQTEPSYIIQVNFVLKLIIAIFLIYRFNSFRQQIAFTELDRRVAHSAGWYILLISFTDYLETIKTSIRKFIISLHPLWIDVTKKEK